VRTEQARTEKTSAEAEVEIKARLYVGATRPGVNLICKGRDSGVYLPVNAPAWLPQFTIAAKALNR
jgi:hypothetical protein